MEHRQSSLTGSADMMMNTTQCWRGPPVMPVRNDMRAKLLQKLDRKPNSFLYSLAPLHTQQRLATGAAASAR